MDRHELAKLNRKHLDGLVEVHGDFHCVMDLGDNWQLYKQYFEEIPGDIRHREVMPSEVVFDFDVKDIKVRDYWFSRLIDNLKRHHVAYSAWTTGGKGIHVHCFFPQILDYPNDKRTALKTAIIDFFTRWGEQSFSKFAKIDYQLCSRHLVRSEYSLRPETNSYKKLISEWQPLIKTPSQIPSQVIDAFNRAKVQPYIRQTRTATGIHNMKFKSIEYLMSEDFAGLKEGRKRALTILCSHFYSTEGDKGIEAILEWNDYKLNGYFTEEKIRTQFNSIKKMVESGKRYGRTSIKNLMNELGVKEEKWDDLVA